MNTQHIHHTKNLKTRRGFTPLEIGRGLLFTYRIIASLFSRPPLSAKTLPRGGRPRSLTGFTLVETLVAISVLLLSVTGPLTIASRSLISAIFARDQITAFYLAQEATELIRNHRDNNSLAGESNWTLGLESCFDANGCIVDPLAGDFSLCPAEGCVVLTRHTTDGLYAYTTGANWEDTRFTRTIRASTVNSSEFSVSVTISWNSGPLNKAFTIQENFLDW